MAAEILNGISSEPQCDDSTSTSERHPGVNEQRLAYTAEGHEDENDFGFGVRIDTIDGGRIDRYFWECFGVLLARLRFWRFAAQSACNGWPSNQSPGQL